MHVLKKKKIIIMINNNDMNCKLKLHSKGFGAEPVLKFLQTLVLDFPHICLQFFRKL